MSDESIKSAELRLSEEFIRGAVSDSYYAAFYILKAILIKNGFITKTHKGAIQIFGEKFINSGKIEKKYGQWLGRLLKERTEATYEATRDFDYDEAIEALNMAKEFVVGVKKVL